MIRIPLSPSQVSALECAGLEGQDQTAGEALLLAAWLDGSRPSLQFPHEQRDAIVDAITNAANSEEALARLPGLARGERAAAMAACNTLTVLARKVRVAVTPTHRTGPASRVRVRYLSKSTISGLTVVTLATFHTPAEALEWLAKNTVNVRRLNQAWRDSREWIERRDAPASRFR